jgi:hypothetical protein
MASVPAIALQHDEQKTSSTEDEAPVRPDERTDEHKARVRASMEWALVEFDRTLSKLAK